MDEKIKNNHDLQKELQKLQKKYNSLQESYQKYISEQKINEDALLKSESQLRESQEVAGLGTYMWDIKTGIWSSSEILDAIFGIDKSYPHNLEGWTNIIHPEWRNQMSEYLVNEVVGKKQKFDKEYKIIRQNDCTIRWVNGLGQLDLDSKGNPVRLKGTITDISLRKSTQEALIKSEANLQALINNKEESIWSLDTDYKLIVCNDFFKNSYHAAYNVELNLGINLVGILSPELKAYWKPKYDTALSGEKITFEFDAEIMGQHFYFEVFLNPIYSDGIISGVSALSVDITERKKNEQELRESEMRFSQLANSSFEGIGIADNGIIVDANEQLAILMGYPLNELVGMNVMDLIAPENHEKVIHSIRNENILPYEHLSVRKDGTVFPVEVQARTVPYKGRMVRVTAVRDITERKLAEESLRSANQKLKLHFEHTPMAVIEWDTEFRVTQWNPSAQAIFGYTQEEAIGKHANFIIPGPDLLKIEPVLNSLLVKSGGERSTNRNITKNGNTIYCEWYNTPLIDESGTVSGVASIVQDITARKLAEEALVESEKKFRQFVEIANEGIIAADKDDKITFLNRRMAELLGYKEEEVINRLFSSFMFEEDLPDYSERMKERRKGKGEIFERKYRRKDGTAIWALVSATPIMNNAGEFAGSLGMLTDITDRKAANEILRESEERFRSVSESANDAIITATHKGVISDWNQGAEKIFGYKAAEIIGKNFTHIVPEGYIDHILKGIKEIENSNRPASGTRTMELNGIRKNKEEFPAEISLAEWKTTSGKFYTGIIRDVTSRKKSEIALIKAKEKAEESDRLKSSFLANMSHEIRTPMNGILGFADLLKNRTLTAKEQYDYITIIQNSGYRMLNILNDLIDISKIESGQVDVSFTAGNINMKTEYIYEFFKPETELKGLKFSLKNGLPENEANIKTDFEKVNAILINLVKNAIKFTREGEIEFGYSKKGKFLEFYVKDTGVGIPDEQKEMIFERFRQGSESLTRNYEGAGLGLSISKSFVTMLNGEISVENNPEMLKGKKSGSVFYVKIPFFPADKEVKEIRINIENEGVELEIRKLNILITEDDEASEKLLFNLVKGFSKTIFIAKSGEEASLVCRDNKKIDLILMDIKLPDMNGLDATRSIRSFNKDVIIIAQTAFVKSNDREEAMDAGCNDFLSKPINRDELLSVLKKYFSK